MQHGRDDWQHKGSKIKTQTLHTLVKKTVAVKIIKKQNVYWKCGMTLIHHPQRSKDYQVAIKHNSVIITHAMSTYAQKGDKWNTNEKNYKCLRLWAKTYLTSLILLRTDFALGLNTSTLLVRCAVWHVNHTFMWFSARLKGTKLCGVKGAKMAREVSWTSTCCCSKSSWNC